MSELSEVWKIGGGGPGRWCRKYGITVSGCSLHYDCKDCKVAKKEEIDAPKASKTGRKKPRIQPHVEVIPVKKRARKSRNDTISRPKANRNPKKVPKGKGNSRVRKVVIQKRLGE